MPLSTQSSCCFLFVSNPILLGDWWTLTTPHHRIIHSHFHWDIICLSQSSRMLPHLFMHVWMTQRQKDQQIERNAVMWPLWPSVLCSLGELCLIVPFCHSCSGPQDNQTGLIVPHSLLQPGSDLTPLSSHSHYLRLLLIYLINSCLTSTPQKSIMAGRFTKLLYQVMNSMSCGVSASSDELLMG